MTPVIHRRAPAQPGAYVERSVPGLLRLPLSLLAAVGLPTSPILRRLRRARYCGAPPACEPDGPAIVMHGTVFPGDARSYLQLPFEVKAGSPRQPRARHVAPGGETGTFGSQLVVARDATVLVTVSVCGGAGQSLRIIRNGNQVGSLKISDDDFRHTFAATRVADEGLLGTWYRVETFDDISRTTIGNPIFLGDSRPAAPGPRAPNPRRKARMRRNIVAARAIPSLPQGLAGW